MIQGPPDRLAIEHGASTRREGKKALFSNNFVIIYCLFIFLVGSCMSAWVSGGTACAACCVSLRARSQLRAPGEGSPACSGSQKPNFKGK